MIISIIISIIIAKTCIVVWPMMVDNLWKSVIITIIIIASAIIITIVIIMVIMMMILQDTQEVG